MFTKKRIVSFVLAAAMMMSLALTACTPTNAPKAAASKYPGTKEENAVTVNISQEPTQMFSTLTTDTVSMNVLRHINVGLTSLDKNDKAVKGVAKDWKISDDQLTYTFTLRDDFKWSNGEKVTAKDFEFAFKGLLSAEFAAPYSYLGYVFKNGKNYNEGKAKAEDVGVKALDDYTLEIKLEQPTPYLLEMLAFGVMQPLNEKAYKEFGKAYGTDANKIVTNGAYKMESWEHESKIVLTKNPDYPEATDIKIDKITMMMIKDSNTAMNSFKSNEIDMIGLNGDQVVQMKGENQPTYSYQDGSNFYLEFNTADKFMKNMKLREALTYAIDGASFVKNIVKNASVAATSFTAPVVQGNKKSFKEEVGDIFKFDIEKAKKLFEEAKAELGTSDIKVSMLIDDGDTPAKYAAFVQEQWKKNLGIEAQIDVQTMKSRITKMQSKDFQVVFAGWGPDYNDPMTFLDMFETGNGNNHTSYSNPQYDELLNKVRVEADRDKRFGYLMDLEKILMTDMPIGPVYFRVRDYTVSNKLEGIVRTAFQDINLLHASIKK